MMTGGMDDGRTSEKKRTGIFESSKSYKGKDTAGDSQSIFRQKDRLKKKRKKSKKAKKKKHG